MTSMAQLLGLTQPAIGCSVDRGERLAKKEKINFLLSYGPAPHPDFSKAGKRIYPQKLLNVNKPNATYVVVTFP